MDAIEAVAARVKIDGIPWDALTKRLNGQDPIFDTAYIYEYLIPAADAATAIFKKYQFWPNPEEVKAMGLDEVRAYQGAADVLSKKASDVLAAANRGTSQLSTADAIRMPLATFRVSVITAYDSALYGATMHVGNLQLVKSMTTQVVAGKMTPEQGSAFMRAHADSCYRSFRAIALMDQGGAFSVLTKAPAAQSGLGFAPVAVVAALLEAGPLGWAVIAIVGVAVIGLVYALIYYLRTTAQQNQQALDIIDRNCAAAAAAKDWATVQQCNKLATDARKGVMDALVDALSGTLNKAIPWLIGAGLIIGGVYFAPLVVRKLSQARKVAHES